jgi:ribosome-associated protein
MPDELVITTGIRIPLEELQFTYARSSGPGGQNVNKVSSKAVLRWNVATTQCLADDVRIRFLTRYRRRITPRGVLLISSQRYRSQSRNVQDCLDKLKTLLLAAATPPTPRKPTRPTPSATRRRLQDKRRSSGKKHDRQARHEADDE